MARGPSGRLVIEVEPSLKSDLHTALAADGLTLKDWFLMRVDEYFVERRQLSLPGIRKFRLAGDEESLRAAEESGIYQVSKDRRP